MAEPEAEAAHAPKPEEPRSEEPNSYEPEKPGECPEEPECPPPPPETSGCEPGVDDLQCVAAGDKAKGVYHDTFQAALTQAKIDYEATRRAYRTEQHDAAPVVQGLENEIRHLVDRIRCQIEQKRVWKCLDDAFCAVRDELRCCPTPGPCCDDPCDFPLTDMKSKTVAELAALIEQYQERTDAAKQCFTTLLGEPAALKERVEAAKTEVSSITTDLGGDAAKVDLKRLYARALVVQWKMTIAWGPFGQTQKFVDCLCQALTCWTKGCEAVYQLTGAKAVADCKERAKKDRCDKLRTDTVEQVLAAYDRLCAEPKAKDEPSEGGHSSHDSECDHDHGPDESDASEEDCEDCGCHHHECDCHRHHHRDSDCHHRHHHGCGEHHHGTSGSGKHCGCD